MPEITVLDQNTVDKIAAGEVIERPSSVVKELVENAIDAGATAVAVEIKDGGTSFIRVADDGCGIERSQVPTAFMAHATSKIRSADDLCGVSSLGFRGEALPSIASVSMVELITKTEGETVGTRYVIEGGYERGLEEIAAAGGTIFMVRNLFYNTPARRKFMKSSMTEAGYVSELVERLALSHPDISFEFVNNGQKKLHTSGNGELKEVIYHIFGRDVASNLLRVDAEKDGISIKGYIGKPVISRGNRGFENYFINGRYIKSSFIARGIEEGYRTYMMQHRYPFTVLHIDIDGSLVDVNVHPSKMELRFSNQEQVYGFVRDSVRMSLMDKDLIPKVDAGGNKPKKAETRPDKPDTVLRKSEPDPEKSDAGYTCGNKDGAGKEDSLQYFMELMKSRVTAEFSGKAVSAENATEKNLTGENTVRDTAARYTEDKESHDGRAVRETGVYKYEQKDLFESKLLDPAKKSDIRIIGQLFETYWLVEFEEKFYMIDQHAAHEKVLYERTMKSLASKEITSQLVSPPVILSLTQRESTLLSENMTAFTRMGFEIGHFGGNEYALSAVPANLFGLAERDIFIEMLDSLEYVNGRNTEIILDKVASMSCKAAVKGNLRLSTQEARALIEELFSLENPYNCPHGRPTVICMTKRDIEKKFKRIV